jgi:hypothetical protein
MTHCISMSFFWVRVPSNLAAGSMEFSFEDFSEKEKNERRKTGEKWPAS